MKLRKHSYGLLSSSSALLFAGLATFSTPALAGQAQNPPASAPAPDTSAPVPPASAPASDANSQEIIVTAQRQSQSAQKVPISITSVTPEAIKELNIRSLERISTVTPSLVFDNGYNIAQIFIRGVGAQNVFGIGLESPVALYIDGVYYPRGYGAVSDLLDPASVEVLKGPQGTLYGRNSSGGAILIRTADPENVLTGRGSVEYGNFDHVMIDGMLNVPVSDTLAVRIAGRYRNEGGFVHNVTTGQDVRGTRQEQIRGKIKWSPTTNFRAILSADYHHQVGIAEASGRQDAVAPFCVGCLFGGATATTNFYQVTEDYARQDHLNGGDVSLRIEYEAPSFKITNIAAYQNQLGTLSDDSDHTSATFFAGTHEYGGTTWSEDVQLATSFNGAFNFLVGAQYIHDLGHSRGFFYGAAAGTPYVNVINGTGIPANAPTGTDRVTTQSYAVFAEAYIKPVDHVTITLGGRFSRDTRRFALNVTPAALALLNPGGPTTSSQNVAYQKFTPRAVIAYDAGVANLYASFTRGFKAGGFGAPAYAPQAEPINPEVIDSYEAGVKIVSPDRRTRFNIAAFYYNYSDVQVSIVDTVHVSSLVRNAAAARGKGVEFDFTHQPVPWLTIGLGGSYLDAKYVTYQNGAVFVPGSAAGYAVGTVDLSGTSLPRAPKWTGYATVAAHAPLGNGWTGHLNAAVHHTSSYLFSPGAGGPLGTDVQNSVTLIGGSMGISPGSDRYKISFYVDNLTQAKYYTNRVIGGFGINSLVAMPRTFGVRLEAGF